MATLHAMPGRRILTALVLTPLAVFAVLWLPSAYFALFSGLVVLVGATEWLRLSGINNRRAAYSYLVVLSGALLVCGGSILGSSVRPWLTWAACLLWAAVAGWIWVQRCRAPQPVKSDAAWGRLGLGLLALVSMWLAVVALHRTEPQGQETVLFLLALIWVADSGAYLVGRRWGRTRLAPGLSPGKTWEGVYGGLSGALMLGISWSIVYRYPLGIALAFVILCVSTAAVSVIGDLFESWMKRAKGVKDSGAILPGHGGLLDRIDSLMAAAPWFVGGLDALKLIR